MKHQSFSMTRRAMLSHGARGISALAVGGSLLGGASLALAGPKKTKKPTKKQLAQVKATMAQAAATVPGDTKLTAAQQKLANLMLQKSKHAMAMGASNPKEKFQQGSLHRVAAKLVGRQTSKRMERARTRAAKLLVDGGASSELNFGSYAKGTLASAKVKQAPDVKITAALRELNDDERKRMKAPPTPMMGDSYKTIAFHLNSTECIEETDEVGADQIQIGGQMVTPTGKIKTISKATLSNDFDEGEIKFHDWEPCYTLSNGGKIDISGFFNEDSNCPHGSATDPYKGYKMASSDLYAGTYALVLVLCEADDGGFEDILDDIYAAVKEEVDAAIEAAAAAGGAVVGSFIPIPGLGTAVGAAIGWICGKIIEFFLSLFDNQDDLIQAQSWSVTLSSTTKYHIDGLSADRLTAPSGTYAHAMKSIDFNGDGGHYQTRMHWRAFG